MKLLFLTLTSLAAIVGMAMPAHADSTDDAFIASLNAAGITYSDLDAVVGAGKWVCDKVNGGTEMSDVVKTLTSKNPSLNPDKASKFAAIAANAYCPDAISAGGAPTSAPVSAPSSAPSSAPVSAPPSAPVSAPPSAPSSPREVPRSTIS
ncbi:hypothetical protein A9W99_22680 [Mycobacterium sp. 1164966.3]|uniref:DUF732 domain-containing protein n=1 Tax=Mycobacterium sp. 1164966.3 TaxID=1856861 RepID=UPI000801C39E|nr:hypothetical protein A9W99_22680 [Mycobacterium sp. 1164966.3]